MGNEVKTVKFGPQTKWMRESYFLDFDRRFERAKRRLRMSGADLKKIILVEGDK